MSETKFIASNKSYEWSGLWHIGLKRESRGEVTGKVFSTYYVTKCNGKSLGGAWGQTIADELPAHASKCPRCFYERGQA